MVRESGGRRRRHSAAERRAVLERLARSEQSVSAFCRAESISPGTLHRWKDEVGPTPVRRAAVPSGFLDLGALSAAIVIEVDLGGGVMLRVRRG
ncbi:MAG: IS66 family insertion sequence element accessory protein TnpA [Solimonas sp.]